MSEDLKADSVAPDPLAGALEHAACALDRLVEAVTRPGGPLPIDIIKARMDAEQAHAMAAIFLGE
jgi:hypothetical protein